MGMTIGRGNAISTIADTRATDVKGIFAAGDATYGTQSVIKAIASGRDAASEIDCYLGGSGDISEKFAPEQKADPYIGQVECYASLPRVPEEIISVVKRKDNFDLVNHGICESRIGEEANRCLQCDLRLQITKPRIWSDYTEKKEANES
jgi:hypothetical protein